jgi:hypothetical protein
MNPDKSKAVSPNQVLAMTDEEKSKLWSVCWHEGQFKGYEQVRCACVGINNFKIEPSKWSDDRYNISWLDGDGGARFEVFDLDKPMHQEGDGEWDYGLYLPHEW